VLRTRPIVAAVAVIAVCAWCGWASSFHRSTGAAEVAWSCSLLAVVLVDLSLWRRRQRGRTDWPLEPAHKPWPRPGRGGGSAALRGVAPWLGLVVVALTWDVLGLDSGPHEYHLTISALSQAYRPLNAALLLVWMLVGVSYEVVRLRAPSRESGDAHVGDGGQGSRFAGMAVVAAGRPRPALTLGLLLPASPAAGVAFWVAVPAAAVLIDAVARRTDGRIATAEEFVRLISTPTLAHLGLVAAWIFAGYHLFAR